MEPLGVHEDADHMSDQFPVAQGQGQLFDNQAFLDVKALRNKKVAEAKRAQLAPLEASRSYAYTGRMPEGVDPLVQRQARQALNMLHVESQHGLRNLILAKVQGTPVYSEPTYGVPHGESYHGESWIPGTFSEHEWRKFGRVEEVPRNRVTTSQPGVAKERVDELVRMPGMGVDPRYSGSMRELPHAVKVPANEWILHQAHHRFMADTVRLQQPGAQQEMFTPMRVVDQPTTWSEEQEASNKLTEYRMQRTARVQAAKEATLGKGRRPRNI